MTDHPDQTDPSSIPAEPPRRFARVEVLDVLTGAASAAVTVAEVEALAQSSAPDVAAFLTGVAAVLRHDFWLAADHWTDWVEGPPSTRAVELLTDADGLVLQIHGPAPMNTEARVRFLHLMASIGWRDGYPLNDAAVVTVVRHLGKAAAWAEAKAFLIGVRDNVYNSRTVRGCLSVVGLALAGKDIPEYMMRYVGDDTGVMNDYVCDLPFRRFDISFGGNVMVCCGQWLPVTIGNVLDDGVEAVLNSDRAQALRRSMVNGRYNYCDLVVCQNIKQGFLKHKKDITDPDILKAMNDGDYTVAAPKEVIYGLDRTCNISCPSCRRGVEVEKGAERDRKIDFTTGRFLELLKDAEYVQINPTGEMLASKPSRTLLSKLNRQDYPNLGVNLISNGTLFSEQEWAKFPGLHDGMVNSIRISLDGCRKETVEKLRRGATWETLLTNLKFIGSLRRDGVIGSFIVSFTYQIDNFREMKDFVAFARDLGADFIKFERLQNIGSFTPEEYRARAVHLADHPDHDAFMAIIADPLFAADDIENEFDTSDIKIR